MISHPLLFSIIIADFLCLISLLWAAAGCCQILLHWSPGSSTRQQLKLEVRSETVSLQGRYSIFIHGAVSFLLIVAIATVLPELVPSAMCGTGVLQASGGLGGRALLMRMISLSLGAAWLLVDRYSRSTPENILTVPAAKILLLTLPVLILAVFNTARGLFSLDIHQPVDCCAAVYDTIRPSGTAGNTLFSHTAFLPGIFGFVSFLILGMAMALITYREKFHAVLTGATAVIAWIWVFLASWFLIRILAAYHYGVLYHHCPWCLFLPEHRLVGYPLFGCLALVFFEGPAILLSARLAGFFPILNKQAASRVQKAGIRIVCAVLLFLTIGGLPALLWRLRYGVWMGQ